MGLFWRRPSLACLPDLGELADALAVTDGGGSSNADGQTVRVTKVKERGVPVGVAFEWSLAACVCQSVVVV